MCDWIVTLDRCNTHVHASAVSRHVYKPMLSRGFKKQHAMLAVFFLSAFFHEVRIRYCVSCRGSADLRVFDQQKCCACTHLPAILQSSKCYVSFTHCVSKFSLSYSCIYTYMYIIFAWLLSSTSYCVMSCGII